MNKALGALLAATVAGLAGCQTNGLQLPEVMRKSPSSLEQRLADLMAFQTEALAMAPEQRARTATDMQRTLPRGCTDQRLKLAMLREAAVQAPPAKGHRLLQPCLSADTPEPIRHLANSLALRMKRQHAAEQQAHARSRTQAEARAEAEAQARAELEQQLQQARRRAEELQRQLEGLKAIERSLQQRDG